MPVHHFYRKWASWCRSASFCAIGRSFPPGKSRGDRHLDVVSDVARLFPPPSSRERIQNRLPTRNDRKRRTSRRIRLRATLLPFSMPSWVDVKARAPAPPVTCVPDGGCVSRQPHAGVESAASATSFHPLREKGSPERSPPAPSPFWFASRLLSSIVQPHCPIDQVYGSDV